MEYVITLFLYLCVIFMLYYLSLKVYIYMLEEIEFTKFLDLVEPGDLILFKWHEVDILHEIFSSFTHVGIVIQIDDRLCILETHLKGDTKKMGYYTSGVNIYDLNQRIKEYEGDIFLLKLCQYQYKREVINQKILDKIEQYKQIPFYDKYREVYQNYCIPRLVQVDTHSKIQKEGMFCSEFIGHILQDLDILDSSYDITCLTPSSFIKLNNKNGNIFYDVKKVKK